MAKRGRAGVISHTSPITPNPIPPPSQQAPSPPAHLRQSGGHAVPLPSIVSGALKGPAVQVVPQCAVQVQRLRGAGGRVEAAR